MAGKTDLSAVKEMTLRILSHRELYGLEIIKAIEEATKGNENLGIAHFTRPFLNWKRWAWCNHTGARIGWTIEVLGENIIRLPA
jgi:hypothetical protein